MRIVFLDCDGVLNRAETKTHIPGTHFYGLDKELIDNLKEFIDKSNEIEETKIVISSSWRHGVIRRADNGEEMKDDCSMLYLKDELAKVGLEIFDTTPLKNRKDTIRGRYSARGYEIDDWLEDHNDLGISNYIILDDQFYKGFDTHIEHWLQTNFYNGGFESKYIELALKILNESTYIRGGDNDGSGDSEGSK